MKTKDFKIHQKMKQAEIYDLYVDNKYVKSH